MDYKLLGRSGLRVSELALGTMTFGQDWGWGAAPDECRAMYEAYRAAGGNFIDTADIYTNGSSERIVGDLVASEREHVVVATKYTMSTARRTPTPAATTASIWCRPWMPACGACAWTTSTCCGCTPGTS